MPKMPNVGFSSRRLLTAGILTACTSSVMAAGFALIEQSASQQGLAFAGGAALADDASTVFFNPAGMTRLPRQFIAAAHVVAPSAEFSGGGTTAPAVLGISSTNATITGGDGGDAGQVGVVPNLYYVAPLSQALYFGLGINAPFGLATDYSESWVGRYHAIESEVRTVNFNPSLAYKVNKDFSIGVGFSVQYIDAKLTQAIDQGSTCIVQAAANPLVGPAAAEAFCAGNGLVPQGSDAFAKVVGDDWSLGYNFGFLFEPAAGTRIGFAYRSKVRHQLQGDARFRNASPFFTVGSNVFVNSNVEAGVDLPNSASLSLYQDINRQWAVMGDITWTGWRSFDELRIKFDDSDSSQPDSVTDESWNNSMRYALGVRYKPDSTWTFRAGAAFDRTPIPDASHRTPRIPGEDRTWVSIGLGFRASRALSFDVGYSHLFVFDDPKINNTTSTGGNLSGDYDASVDIVSAQVVWNI